MKHASLSREIYDSRNIRVIGGFGELGASGSDETDSMISSEPIYNTENQKDDDSDENSTDTTDKENEMHRLVWSREYEGRRRVVSHGDLKFDLGNRIVAVLPLYFIKGQLTPMAAITGQIVDITSVCVDGKDVPREVRLRVSPDSSKIRSDAKGSTTSKGESIYANLQWAEDLVIRDWKEERNRAQTMVISYKILLDQPFRLNQTEIDDLYKAAATVLRLPYRYNRELSFSISEAATRKKKSKARPRRSFEYVTVSYRYVMGLENSCKRAIALSKRCNPADITIDDIQDLVSKSKLSSGVFVQHSDLDQEQMKNDVLNFVILDHLCQGPNDIRFIVRCSGSTQRVLAISKLTPFDVRCAYPVDDYHCFHPIERYVYSTVNPNDNEFNQTNSIKEAIRSIFLPIEVYIVKKSLCNPTDIEYNVYEDPGGNVKYVPVDKNSESQPTDLRYAGSTSSTPKGHFRYSGISLASYVRGLAYPEGNCPAQHDLYTFFNSKDYFEIDLNPDSPTFLEYICTSASHSLFRNPMGKDIILAVPFVCDRDQHKGKTNLRWFYPSDELRLLHLYIKTDGNHPHFKLPPNNKKGMPTDPKAYLRSMFTGITLCIIDLLIYGLSKANPTLKSKFSRRFISRFFWWEKLNLEIQQDPNFDYLDD